MFDNAGLNWGVPDFRIESVMVALFGTGPLTLNDPDMDVCDTGAVDFELMTRISF